MPQPTTTSRVFWRFVVFLLPFAVLAAHHWNWGPPAGAGDYAQYLVHARAIVEGRPYTDIGYIYHPGAPMVGPRAYPPGLPLTLAPIVAFAGVHSPLIRVLMLATVLAFAFFAFRDWRWHIATVAGRDGGGHPPLSPGSALRHAGIPAPDAGLCALLWAAVLAVDRAESWTWRRIALVPC